MRRSEALLFALLVVAVSIAAVAGLRRAPRGDLTDPRLSTELAGPQGAKAFRLALERLGISVEPRRRALFDLGADTAVVDTLDLLLLLDVTERPTDAERNALVRYVERGGAVLTAGWNYDVERCLDFEVQSLRGDDPDSLSVLVPEGIGDVPPTHAVFVVSPEPDEDLDEADRCAVLEPSAIDTLLRAEDGRPVALRLEYAGGGRVTAWADARYFTNRALRETDAAALVIPWMLDRPVRRALVDEYHHGFGSRGSIFAAAWAWSTGNPAGWMLLQLGLSALLVIFAHAVRFGPAQEVVQRERRSPMEHLDALALGLERAHGASAAKGLIIQGLRRRLGGKGAIRTRPRDLEDWLAALSLGARSTDARASVARLGRLAREKPDDSQVMEVALAVEDVWEALGHQTQPKQY